MEKNVVLGAGHVGSHCAQALALRGIGREIVLVDVLTEKATAQALDIADALSFTDHATAVRSGSYADCADAAFFRWCSVQCPFTPDRWRLRCPVLMRARSRRRTAWAAACWG